MWLTLVLQLIASSADPTSAEAVFKRMEQQVLKSQTLQVQLESQAMSGKERLQSLKGRLALAPKDKVRLELSGEVNGMPEKLVMVSDGKKQRLTSLLSPRQDQDAVKHHGEAMLSTLSRLGIAVGFFVIVSEDSGLRDKFDAEKELPISDLKLGRKEVLSGREVQILEFTILPRGYPASLAATVWVDKETNFPIKRVVTLKDGTDTITVTESYTRFVIDGKIDETEFELPK